MLKLAAHLWATVLMVARRYVRSTDMLASSVVGAIALSCKQAEINAGLGATRLTI